MSPLDDCPAGDGPTDGERDYLAHDASVSMVHSILHHPLLRATLRSAIAAGIAYELGSFLPIPLGEYPYYAALGALTVLLPVVRDSAWEGPFASRAPSSWGWCSRWWGSWSTSPTRRCLHTFTRRYGRAGGAG